MKGNSNNSNMNMNMNLGGMQSNVSMDTKTGSVNMNTNLNTNTNMNMNSNSNMNTNMNQQNYNVNVQTPMCLNRHALSLLVNYCNNCGSNSNPICYKCIPCNYSVCAACAMKLWNINVNSNVNVNINTGGHNVQVQKEEKPAIPCFQCKGELSSNIGEIETQFAVNVNPPHVTLPIAA